MDNDSQFIKRRPIKREKTPARFLTSMELNAQFKGVDVYLGYRLAGMERLIYTLLLKQLNIIHHSFEFKIDIAMLAINEGMATAYQAKQIVERLQQKGLIKLKYIDTYTRICTVVDMRYLVKQN